MKNDKKHLKKYQIFFSVSPEIWKTTEELQTCSPIKSISFAKTHKTGSSTVQNIFLRYGWENNLTFVLPEKRTWMFGFKTQFRWSTCRLRFCSWLLDYVIYFKLLLQAEQLTKWQLFSLLMTTFTKDHLEWKKLSFSEFAQLVTTVIFFSAWYKSRDPTVNLRILDDM